MKHTEAKNIQQLMSQAPYFLPNRRKLVQFAYDRQKHEGESNISNAARRVRLFMSTTTLPLKHKREICSNVRAWVDRNEIGTQRV